MKTEELMIGAWVLDTEFGRNIQDQVMVTESDGRVWLRNRNSYESAVHLKPIPLTPEILEKNGFYFGYTSGEEDLCSNTIADLNEDSKGWVWDEGAGSVKVIFPNESDGGVIYLDDQSFDRRMTFVFVESLIMVHEFQHLLRLCNVKKELIL